MSRAASLAETSPNTAPGDRYPSRTGNATRLLPRTEPVVYARDKDSGPLARHLVDQFEDSGFFILENVFSAAETRALQQESARVRANVAGDERVEEPGQGAIRSVFAIHETDSLFARLPRDRRFMEIAQFLLDDDVYLHQSRLNYKPGFCGREFFWHSDFETWHVEDGMPAMRAVSMSVTLTSNTPDNGPLLLVPGSHRQFVGCEGETPEKHFRQSLRRQEYGTPERSLLEDIIEENGIRAADAPAGSVIFFDCNMLHGSNGNITPYPRSNAFYVYNAMSNQVVAPFCGLEPRPEYLCERNPSQPLRAVEQVFVDG